MIAFAILAAVLIALVLALLLWPLLVGTGKRHSAAGARVSNVGIYREQLAELDTELEAAIINREQWELARGEVERRVLDDGADAEVAVRSRSPRAAIVVAVFVPVLALGLYTWLGSPEAFSPQAAADSASAHSVTADQIEGMINRLAERLKEKPEETEGWILLGRTYAATGRYDAAAKAYAKASSQQPKDAQLLADFADVLAMAQGRKLDGEPAALIARALAIDPDNVKALSISGTIAFDRKDFTGAIKSWKRALALVPPESEYAGSVRSSIAEAESRMGVKVAQVAPPAPNASTKAAPKEMPGGSAGALSGRVVLSAAAAAKVRPDDSVFVFARAAEGPRMPLAVMRRQVKDLPFDFSLDDSMAMTPTLKVSGFPRVVVVARVSRSGLATPQKGDLEAASAALAPGARGIKLELVNPVD